MPGHDADTPAHRDDITVIDPDDIDAGTDALGIGAGEAPPGTYALVYSLATDATISVGALGTAAFPTGAYAYVGSAFGSNGLGRVDRHRRVADGDHGVRHWHVDYLGGHPAASLDAVVAAPNAAVECGLASALCAAVRTDGRNQTPLAGFGASDCDCVAHLVGADDVESLRSAAVDALRRIERQDLPSER
ncbi:DUF123 domain-containing protein [Halobellus sp. GM3]|uniref:DUF123 domain-containing protein n=1 Tax=Halobellus sp. GM3 TaxID=3458410 RepID=UPI00403D77C5